MTRSIVPFIRLLNVVYHQNSIEASAVTRQPALWSTPLPGRKLLTLWANLILLNPKSAVYVLSRAQPGAHNEMKADDLRETASHTR